MPATTTELTGVFVNGHIVPDSRPLPDGTRVRFVPVSEDEDDDIGPPPPDEPYDRAAELQILRDSYADALAGRTRPLKEAMDEIRVKYGLPPRRED